METASYYSISCPARFCEERNVFETLDVIVDVDSGAVDLVSEDKKGVIRLDLIGADTLRPCLENKSCTKQQVCVNYPYGNETI